jgi:hypothetical protein
MIAFIVDQRAVHGVEPICKVLPPFGLMIPRIINFPHAGDGLGGCYPWQAGPHDDRRPLDTVPV